MTIRRILSLAALGLLAALPLGAIEAALAPGERSFSLLATPALADDDDDDDDGPSRSRRSFRDDDDDDDDRPRRALRSFADDDDDDDDYAPAPRRRQAAPRQARRQPAAARPELVASGLDAAALGRVRAAGFTVLSERRLGLLPETTARLRAPRNLSSAGARAQLAGLAPAALVDDNSLYRPNAREACAAGACFPYLAKGWTVPVCAARGTVGMIDTRVDAKHPALAGRALESAVTRSEKRAASSTAHGTEVAILLAGAEQDKDDMRLVAVDAFHRVGGADRADAFDLVAAIDLLAERKAGVVNLSLAGPPNALLDRAGAVAAERGMILVVAVGNDGASAAPRYPAAYPWAVAVTAIDAGGEVYAKAGRGSHVAFAAPGVRLQLPDAKLKPGRQRSGTSYAAPLVAAALSAHRAAGADQPPAQVVASLAASVEDMGAPGRDPVFGWGALDKERSCPTARRAGG